MSDKLFGAIIVVALLFAGNMALIAAWSNSAQVDGYRLGYADAKAGRPDFYAPTPKKCELK